MRQGTLKQLALDYVIGFFTPISVTTGEVALRIGAPQASARRILGELCKMGLVTRSGYDKTGKQTTWVKLSVDTQ